MTNSVTSFPECDKCGATTAHFCEPRAQHIQDFFEKILTHTKGKYYLKPFVLADWQLNDIVKPLFGQVVWSNDNEQWVRQHKVAWIELARKNGKSEILAGIALYLLIADSEPGAEIYSCAKDRDQARKVFDVAAQMVKQSPLLSERLKIYNHNKRITDESRGSFYEIISADGAGNLGHNPHGVIFDEVLTQPNDELWNTMRTAMGTRTQPLMIAATTAGNDPSGFCAAEHSYCEKIQDNKDLDPSRFVYLRNTPKDADWQDEANWYFANPALGDFLNIESLREEAREAKLAPSKQNSFRQFRLNQWVQQSFRWLDLNEWDNSGKGFRGSYSNTCWAGLDLASSKDIAALALCFPEKDEFFRFEWRFWLPESQLADIDRRTGGKASVWVREGFLKLTEGNVIDYEVILYEIMEIKDKYDLRQLAYDKWGMTQLAQDLMRHDIDLVEIPQNHTTISPPSKEFERLILKKKLVHNDNPVMRWMVDNVVVRTDAGGNIKPDKQHSGDKIDGIVAAVMALDRAQKNAGVKRGCKLVSY